jgi:hypothetical protein
MCLAIATPVEEPLRIVRLVEYFDPRIKEIVFDVFCDGVCNSAATITMLHRGNVNVGIETRSLVGLESKSDFVSFIARRSEMMHREDGWLAYRREGQRIVMESPITPRSFECFESGPKLKSRTGDVPSSEHRAFTTWEIGSLPQSPFALRMHLTMVDATAEALTGSKIGESPEFYWIYGDSLLLDAVEGECGGPEAISDFRRMRRIRPELFEYIETSSASIDNAYTAYPLSMNTVRQNVPEGLDGSTNWFVLTPYEDGLDQGLSPYEGVEIRFDTLVRS